MASHLGLEAVRPWELAGVDASFRGLSFCWPVITSGPLSEPLSDEGRLIGRLGFADPAARGSSERSQVDFVNQMFPVPRPSEDGQSTWFALVPDHSSSLL